MSPGGPAARMPLALLLLWLPDCFRVRGPSMVWGTVGGSLSLQCRYDEELKPYNKFWCRKSHVLSCDKIVETKGSEREVRSGRVFIRDRPANLTFTVTVDSLTLEDAGSYLCGVNVPWAKNPTVIIEVSVLPDEPHTSTRASWRGSDLTSASTPESSTSTQGPPMSLSPQAQPNVTREDSPGPHQQPGSLLSSAHFLRLVLAVPLLLSMLGAVLWVHRPQRRPGEARQHDSENQ